MSLVIVDNFSYKGRQPLDARNTFPDIASMVATAEAIVYEGIFVYNEETKKYYTFNPTNTDDPTLGKWREFKQGSTDVATATKTGLVSVPTNGGIAVSPQGAISLNTGSGLTIDSNGQIGTDPDLVPTATVTTNPDGTQTITSSINGTPVTTQRDAQGNVTSTVLGGQVVDGSLSLPTQTTTSTDAQGQTVTTTTDVVITPSGTTRTVTAVTDLAAGGQQTSTQTVTSPSTAASGNTSAGVSVSNTTTTVTDSLGTIVSTETDNNHLIIEEEESPYISTDDIDDMMNDIAGLW